LELPIVKTLLPLGDLSTPRRLAPGAVEQGPRVNFYRLRAVGVSGAASLVGDDGVVADADVSEGPGVDEDGGALEALYEIGRPSSGRSGRCI
jgi:hypothetical protein